QIMTTANILLVDDTPSNLDVLTAMLKESGYRVRPAINGELALEAVKASPPDLILLDINLPKLNGYEVCIRLKADETTRDIPVIFISALNDVEAIVKAFEVGGVDYITKPFKLREVLARVATHLMIVQQRRQIEERYVRDMKHFEALDKMKEQFVRSATHDLKNPLSIVTGYVALLQTLTPEEFAQYGAEYIDGISGGAKRMLSLITDMLDLAQLQTGANLKFEPTDVENFMNMAMRGMDVAAKQRHITLVYTPPAKAVTVVIDPHQMMRVIDNLVSNAIKYTPDGGRVDVFFDIYDDAIGIRVRDTGFGIPKKDIDHIFDAFYRVRGEQQSKVSGTGLGLAIVRTIVEQHNGQIEVESEVGHGSLFTVFLRRA
ncbi:MAG: hybrid sensor histidine kinase/response regulator, partial [Anaerolineae bacterium]|nr:hybrid sensor histidine kinase/response regulator [Anaerolineae bacterium]